MNDKQKAILLVGVVSLTLIILSVLGTFIALVWTLIQDMT